MRRALATVATAALLAGGAVACSDSPPRDRDDCRPRVTVTAGKHRPPGGRSGGSRSQPRPAPKPKPKTDHDPVYVPVPAHRDCR